ncbi:MAG: vanadium-dependent haloperoxidase [Saprospirales bacterium]|nr:vanadium-dependent haloperoxidase [Saprospirales bacterium]
MSILLFQSCREYEVEPPKAVVSAYDCDVFLKWNDVFLQIDRYAVGYRPGPVPHALGYMGFAAYEAVVPGMPGHNSLANLYSDLAIPKFDEGQEYYWPAVINEVYAFMMKRFFFHMETAYPNEFGLVEEMRQQLHNEYALRTTPEILERSEARGVEVARAIYDWEKEDIHAHNAFLNPQPPYNAPTGPGFWEPTIPDFVQALFPFWGQVRTFALREEEQLARLPIPYSENPQSLFFSQALEVFSTVKNIKENGPGAYEQRWLAEFWSDDILGLTFSPPARLIAVANQVVKSETMDLEGAAELYAKMGMALNDIGVAVWQSKYVYNLERPVSYIRRVMPQYYPDAANWTTLLNNPVSGYQGITPAFPAYPSGHSGFGGAGGKILSDFFEFKSNHPGTYTFTDRCHINRSEFIGTPRTLASFKDLAYEDAYSRIPLGVHFRMDCDEGVRLGELAAQRVLELPWKK